MRNIKTIIIAILTVITVFSTNYSYSYKTKYELLKEDVRYNQKYMFDQMNNKLETLNETLLEAHNETEKVVLNLKVESFIQAKDTYMASLYLNKDMVTLKEFENLYEKLESVYNKDYTKLTDEEINEIQPSVREFLTDIKKFSKIIKNTEDHS